MIRAKPVKLGLLCEFISGGTPNTKVERYYGGDIPWITSADVGNDKITPPRRYITQEAIESSATNIVPKGNLILVTRTGVGKVAITDVDICISQDFTGIVPDQAKLSVPFLFYYLKAKKDDLVAYQRGATIKGITRKVVASLPVPLPSLEEQRRIAGILARADRLRRLRRFAADLGSTYLQSVFIEMFGAYLESEVKTRFKDVLEQPLRNGLFEKNDQYGEGVPVIWVDDLYHTISINTDDLRRVDIDQKTTEKYQVEEGDLLFTRSSLVREGIGQVNIVPSLSEPTTFECHIIRARVDRTKASPYYVLELYRSDFGKSAILKRSKTATMTTIAQAGIETLPCPLPPLPLQEQFAAIVRRVEHLRAQQRESERQAEHLFQTLLHRAFAGGV